MNTADVPSHCESPQSLPQRDCIAGARGILCCSSLMRVARVVRHCCAVSGRAPRSEEELEGPCLPGWAGPFVLCGLCRGGALWAHHPVLKSDPKVRGAGGGPHYGVPPVLSTLVGPFCDPGSRPIGASSSGGGVPHLTPLPEACRNTCTLQHGIVLPLLETTAANPKRPFHTPRPHPRSTDRALHGAGHPTSRPGFECSACSAALAEGRCSTLRVHTSSRIQIKHPHNSTDGAQQEVLCDCMPDHYPWVAGAAAANESACMRAGEHAMGLGGRAHWRTRP